MTESSQHVLHLMAQADGQPVESDAPPENRLPPYDTELQADLLEHGPAALQEWGQIVVRGIEDEARFNSGCWYALAHYLDYESRDGCLIITDPSAS